MNFFYPTRILAFFSLFLAAPQAADQGVIVHNGKTVRVVVPRYPLAEGSLKVEANGLNLAQWQESQQNEAYETIQKIVNYWKTQGINDYLIYGKETGNATFNWEVVPFQKSGWRFWKQFKVLWNVTFGGWTMPVVERQRIAREYHQNIDFSAAQIKQIEAVNAVAIGNDAFCKKEVIDKQRVFEGRKINILYNYAPIENLHFLLVPKRHVVQRSELTKEEYLESVQLAQKLIGFYKDRGYTVSYLFDKTGEEAGQTVPHWHQHVIFTATKTQQFIGKLKVLKNMLFGASPLPAKELQDRVSKLRSELNQ